MPAAGPLPGHPDAWVCGSVHSGYTSGIYIAQLLAEHMLERVPAMPLFPIDRLLASAHGSPFRFCSGARHLPACPGGEGPCRAFSPLPPGEGTGVVQRDWLLYLQVQVPSAQFSVWRRSDIRQALGVTR